MIVIADSGATKTHWVIIQSGKIVLELYSSGFNPYYYKAEDFIKNLREKFSGKISYDTVNAVYFYAAGCSSPANVEIIRSTLSTVFKRAEIYAHHDLYGAAIALLGNKSGIACILGTGSNSCLWDGNQIVNNVPSVGYLLGDEGGGTYIGKLLVREILLGIADKEIISSFYKETGKDFSSVLDRVYKKPQPNKFFSQQTKFLRRHISNDYCKELVIRSFEDFIHVQLNAYPGVKSLPVCFTGSVAANFKDLLQDALSRNHIKLGKVIKEPIEGLVAYHSSLPD